MSVIDNFLLISSISGFTLSMVACCLVLISNKTNNHSRRLLAVVQTGLASILLVIFLFKCRPDWYAYIFRVPSSLLYLLFPCCYLYTRSVVYNDTGLRKKDYIHFLPAILYTVELIPYFFKGYTYKLQLVKYITDHPRQLILLNEGFLPDYFHLGFLCVQCLLYVVLIVNILRKAAGNKEQAYSFQTSAARWMKIFISSTSVVAIPMLAIFLSPQGFRESGVQFLLLTITLSFLSSTMYLFFTPELLYGISFNAVSLLRQMAEGTAASEEVNQMHQRVSENESSLVDAENEFSNLEGYKPILELHIKSAKPFLKQGYSIYDLSRETGIAQHHLSALLNRIYKQRFSDFINGMRIGYIIENFGNPEWEKLTLEGIAKQAGFTSRTTFFNAIKKIIGTNPSKFIAQLKMHSKTHVKCKDYLEHLSKPEERNHKKKEV